MTTVTEFRRVERNEVAYSRDEPMNEAEASGESV